MSYEAELIKYYANSLTALIATSDLVLTIVIIGATFVILDAINKKKGGDDK